MPVFSPAQLSVHELGSATDWLSAGCVTLHSYSKLQIHIRQDDNFALR